jgi:P4 family phage/plasmid primase-like protien
VTQDSTLHLSENHRKELEDESAIDPAVIMERGYRTIERPNLNGGVTHIPGVTFVDGNSREFLRRAGFPSWAIREDYYFPGLWIPQYTPSGQRYAGQFKPFRPVSNRDGKRMKYASAKGTSRLDVHPRWSADRGQRDAARVPAIQDPREPLWITEGVKKADALTSRGCVTVALAGVYNWRNTHATLADWEDVRIKGREVWICFDADTVTKPEVQRAMDRLGRWLRFKGAAKVWYLVVPPGVNGHAVKGVDDYLAAGGTLKDLEKEAKDKPPRTTDASDRFTDATLAETLAAEVLDGAYVWAAGLDWLGWNGQRWTEVHEVTVIETVRSWAKDQFLAAAARLKAMEGEAAGEVDGWRPMLSASRIKAVLSLARGIVERKAEDFDTDPDLINTPAGVVNLVNGEIIQHDPDLLMTKITSGSYRPGFTHKDWTTALQALPADVEPWFRARIGQAITGHTTPDGIVPILQGGGENGKGALTTGGLLPALGGYASAASPKLFMSTKNEHSTERADLRGMRLVVAEELTEGRSIDVTALKQVADVERIRARRTHRDNMEFDTSHSIMATTNYVPVIAETDHGTWRRLALVRFPFTFVKPGTPITDKVNQRRGDPTLKGRLKNNPTGQHDAMVTWAIAGAVQWYASVSAIENANARGEEPPASVLALPERVEADTLAWRIEADRILGFWTEVIEPDVASAVLTSELHEVFNAWLRTNGHGAWSKETFGPRFGEHSETKRHHIRRKRTRDLGPIVRPPAREARWLVADGPERALPKQPEVWLGLRYRMDEDRS